MKSARRGSRWTEVALIAVVIVALLTPLVLTGIVSGATGAVAAGNETATPTPTATPTDTTTPTPTETATPAGSDDSDASNDNGASDASDDTAAGYSLRELRRGGTQPADAPPSVRYLDTSGAVSFQYVPAAPLKNDARYLNTSQTIHTDDLTVYSARFGPTVEPKKYLLRVVFYQVGTRTVTEGNQTRTERYVSDANKRDYTVTLGTQYDRTQITLPSHYDEQWQVTMWLVNPDTGEPVDGARWRFVHQTSPTQQGVSIDSTGDLLVWVAKNVLMIAIPGLLGVSAVVRAAINRSGRGPDKGARWWAVMLGFGAMIVATVGYFRTAQLLARAPQLMGGAIVVVGGIVMLEVMGPRRQTDVFVRDELTDADSPMGEGLKNVLYRDQKRIYTARTEEGKRLLKPGIRPFLARLFADPALLDTSKLKTEIDVRNGPDDSVYIASPGSDDALKWRPARWRLNFSLFREPYEDDASDASTPSDWRAMVRRFRSTIVFGPLVGYIIGSAVGREIFNAGATVGGILAVAALLAVAAEAVDGEARFEPAEAHYREARPTMQYGQIAHKKAKEVSELWDRLAKSNTQTALEMKNMEAERSKTVTELLAKRELGVDPHAEAVDELVSDGGDATDATGDSRDGPDEWLRDHDPDTDGGESE